MGVMSGLFGVKGPEHMVQIDNPAGAFDNPSDVVSESSLSNTEKESFEYLGAGCPPAYDRQQ